MEPGGEASVLLDGLLFEEIWFILSTFDVSIYGMIGFVIPNYIFATSVTAENTFGSPFDRIWKFLFKVK